MAVDTDHSQMWNKHIAVCLLAFGMLQYMFLATLMTGNDSISLSVDPPL